ncbi:MAG: hypothetical protein KIT32_12175 [Rhodocyclaceae bacterium]|nr:hypothetical protein [Rhodocyclaceae bacterium]
MGMTLPKPNDSDFVPPPQGTHLAVCYRVIDLGTQMVEWQGQKKTQHKIMLSWELPNEVMESGEPFVISQRYTWSSSEKARLRQDLEAWRGKKFNDADFGPGGFDIKNIIGKACYLNIVHTTKEGKTYANISAVVQLPKGTETPICKNLHVFFTLDEPDEQIFNGLSDGLKALIQKSPEWAEYLRRKEGIHDAPPAKDKRDFDDEIPF